MITNNNYPPGHQPGYPPSYPQHYQPHHQPHHEKCAPTIIQQPVQNQSTNVTVNATGQYVRRRGWSTGLCGCCEDPGVCCCVMFCTPFQMFNLAIRLDEVLCLPCLVPQWMMALRIKLRESNNIAGSILVDCLVTTYCPTLAMCQMIRELDNIDRKKPGTQL